MRTWNQTFRTCVSAAEVPDEYAICRDRNLVLQTSVVTKYKTAAEICNGVLTSVKEECKIGAKVMDLCYIGDDMIEDSCAKIFKGKSIEKGIAFPTCVSINHCVGHYSPLADEATLSDGDVVKIDLGVHIDGFIAVQATTVIISASMDQPVSGRAADLLACAHYCFEAAMRLIRPGNHVRDVSGPLQTIAESFGCTLVEGVMTHNMKQFVIDGNKCVLNRPASDQRVDDAEFEENEVYAVDIVVSTGDGKARVVDEKQTTVFKRALNVEYSLKLKSSRTILSDIDKRYPCMPFPLRKLLATSTSSKFGLVECLQHGLLHAYPVLWEKDGELVAHIKSTVLLMRNGSDRITVSPLQSFNTSKTIEDEGIKQLLATSVKSKKKNAKKKAAVSSQQ
uniref:Proliferation-associated protein 1 n=1 Tax=Ulva partita TaxID=1605170 RepID=A0A1C9ZPM8_9CHLO|nr:proliferation-associated protein 1 [Ulva partita]